VRDKRVLLRRGSEWTKKKWHQLSMFSIKVGHSSKPGRASDFESLESLDIQRG
jgi:hypothetical protein